MAKLQPTGCTECNEDNFGNVLEGKGLEGMTESMMSRCSQMSNFNSWLGSGPVYHHGNACKIPGVRGNTIVCPRINSSQMQL
jgi:hypothetical protein